MGRWTVTLAEVEEAFVKGKSVQRQDIWDDFLQLTEALRHVVDTVPAVWVGGSFLTDKDEPSDVDAVYVVEAWRVLGAKANVPKAQFLEMVASSGCKDHGINVDSYLLEWVPRPGVVPAPWASSYRERRGYWDDLWSRERSPDPRTNSVPRIGYLEVILDGYV